MAAADPSVDALLHPISDAEPAGVDISYTDVYGRIREAKRFDPFSEEREKLPDWRLVAEIGSEALQHRSKDLQLAVWVTEAWCYTHGLNGAANGFRLLAGLLERFWDHGLYPRSEDEWDTLEFRLARFEWLNAKLPSAILQTKATIDDHAKALTEFRNLKTVLNDRFGASTPDLGAIGDSLQGHSQIATIAPKSTEPSREDTVPVKRAKRAPDRASPPTTATDARDQETAEPHTETVRMQCGRDEFRRRATIAECCLATAQEEVALGILEDLATTIERYQLERWERPDFLGRVLLPLYRCYLIRGDFARTAQLMLQLCRIDPALAMAAADAGSPRQVAQS